MPILGLWFQRDHVSKADELYRKGEKLRAAELYQKARAYDQAAKVFAELEEIDRAVECHLEGRQPVQAAELLESFDDPRAAITHYERAGAYRRAAEAAVKANNLDRAARNFEKASMYRRAAETYAEIGEHEQALRVWELEIESLRQDKSTRNDPAVQAKIHNIDLLRAEVLENLRRYGDAAEILRRYGTMTARRAGELFANDKRFAEAAEAFLDANANDKALEAIEEARDADDALRATVYLRSDKYREAAEIFHRMGRLEEAAKAYAEAAAWEEAAELFEKAGDPKQAAEYFHRTGRFADAARCYTKVNMYQQAGKAYDEVEQYGKAAEAYRQADMRVHAANSYLKGRRKEAAFEILVPIPKEDADYPRACLLRIPLLLKKEMIKSAEERFDALLGTRAGSVDDHERWYCQGRIEEAKKLHEKAEETYQKVLAFAPSYGDTKSRLENLRRQLTGAEAAASRPSNSSGAFPLDTLPTPAATAESVPDLSNLPFTVQSQIGSWWDGAMVFHAVDRRRKKSILLISFPQSYVPHGAEYLRQRIGRYTGLDFAEVLNLEEVLPSGGNVILIYEAFSGRTLADRLTGGELEPAVALGILRQICSALRHGHKVNIIHQWLSPRTILVDDDYRVKLIGFGLAEIFAHDHTSQAYKSPELEAGSEGSPASDIFSVGLLGAELLQALLPADRENRDPDPDTVGWPENVQDVVPKRVRNLLVTCLRKDPMKRPTAGEILSGLASVGFLPGQVLEERYEILGELGQGGMSRVYRARHLQLDEELAVKTLIQPELEAAEDHERLLREVQICRKLSHPNIVRVHDVSEIPGGIFLTMELLSGPSLEELIEEEAPLSLERVRNMLLDIAGALAEAHRVRVVHRDLKPANIMLDGDRVKVLDFGIAHIADGRSKKLTRAGDVIGSPLYMAPEQIQGEPLGGTCDLYALGVITYGLLTGHEPFQAETATAVVWKHLNEPPPDIFKFRPDLPKSWHAMVLKLLEKKAEDRYCSAEELIEVIRTLPV